MFRRFFGSIPTPFPPLATIYTSPAMRPSGNKDEFTLNKCTASACDTVECSLYTTSIKTQATPEELEMYNLTNDPLEEYNLAHPDFATEASAVIQTLLLKMLEEQCKSKRLYPSSGNVPGKPSCHKGVRNILNI